MSAKLYQEKALKILSQIVEEESENIRKASEIMVESIASGHLVHLFGSGHSAIPAMDIFPRYGSYVGLHPLIDPRLIWFNVIGPGGARELLWIERQEGYIKNFLQSFNFYREDSIVIYSHGGLNAAPVEAALYAKDKGMKVIAVTSIDNYKHARPTHSSGKSLADIADVVIDNCAPLEDSIVEIEGQNAKIGASSTLSVIFISMSLLCETAKLLGEKGIELPTFVSPNVTSLPKDNNEMVYEKYTEYVKNLKV